MRQVHCTKCDFRDEYEEDEFGLTYYEAYGICILCDAPMHHDDDDTPTAHVVTFIPTEENTK
jgi:uncharacterized protein YlaI